MSDPSSVGNSIEESTEQGSTYAAFIAEELQAERDRWQRIDARGSSILTSSGAVVTLLAALSAIVLRDNKTNLPESSGILLVVAVAAFGIAALFALFSTYPRRYLAATTDDLTKMRRDRWEDDEVNARNYVAYMKIQAIVSLRRSNNVRAAWLVAGLGAQVTALAALIWAIGSVVTDAVY
ncbi:hypothetical protein [Micromonospora sp. CPCC 206061]|uniref:hypothetical protein n=1 Tax=Micromonospora sp. CPCC 206061 TaxID=3122410 RepID=UPI002FEFEFEC